MINSNAPSLVVPVHFHRDSKLNYYVSRLGVFDHRSTKKENLQRSVLREEKLFTFTIVADVCKGDNIIRSRTKTNSLFCILKIEKTLMSDDKNDNNDDDEEKRISLRFFLLVLYVTIFIINKKKKNFLHVSTTNKKHRLCNGKKQLIEKEKRILNEPIRFLRRVF